MGRAILRCIGTPPHFMEKKREGENNIRDFLFALQAFPK